MRFVGILVRLVFAYAMCHLVCHVTASNAAFLDTSSREAGLMYYKLILIRTIGDYPVRD